MQVQIERGAESLKNACGPGFTVLNAKLPASLPVPAEDGANDDPERTPGHLGVAGEQVAALPGKGQDPLPYGNMGDDPVAPGRRPLGHTSPTTTGAEAPCLAGEGDDAVVAAA